MLLIRLREQTISLTVQGTELRKGDHIPDTHRYHPERRPRPTGAHELEPQEYGTEEQEIGEHCLTLRAHVVHMSLDRVQLSEESSRLEILAHATSLPTFVLRCPITLGYGCTEPPEHPGALPAAESAASPPPEAAGSGYSHPNMD